MVLFLLGFIYMGLFLGPYLEWCKNVKWSQMAASDAKRNNLHGIFVFYFRTELLL